MAYLIECTYCGYKWEYEGLNKGSLKCLKCNDKKVKVREKEDVVIDTYIECPPFPEKKDRKDQEEPPSLLIDFKGIHVFL